MVTTKQQGFNLIELMVVLAVSSILIGLGLPSLKSSLDRKAVTGESTRFARSLNFARSQAVNSQQVVTLAISTDDGDWSKGWTIFVDVGGEGNEAMVAADLLLRDVSIDSNFITINAKTNAAEFITFTAQGRLSNAVVLAICDKDQSEAFDGSQMSVSVVGRSTTRTIAAADKAKDGGC